MSVPQDGPCPFLNVQVPGKIGISCHNQISLDYDTGLSMPSEILKSSRRTNCYT